ncbi:MAG TPA: ABC transporter permease [Streptosporangiaceae bacterium]|jgi:ABC-2 type transport system permease protein
MTTLTTTDRPAPAGQVTLPLPSGTFALGALIRRDLTADVREYPTFVLQVLVQPMLMLFVFGRILPALGVTRPGYGTLLLPGIIATTVFVTTLQSTALPLVVDFSYSKEIEDRLLSPISVRLLAVEKLAYAALRGLVAGAIMAPLGLALVPGTALAEHGWPAAIGIAVIGSIGAAGLGMVLGTALQVQRINLIFTAVLTPLLFTGCAQYPWPSLAVLRWFQIVTLANPLTYLSEGMRGTLAPAIPHLAMPVAISVLSVLAVSLCVLGVRGFVRRAVD